MKFIKPVVEFSHDSKTYYVGERRYVEEGLAGYFCNAGWADLDDQAAVPAVPGEVVLKIQNGKHGLKSTFPVSE